MLLVSAVLKMSTMLIFLSLLFEKIFITVAYFSLLTEIAETFGAILVTAALTNFMTFSNSVTHSSTPAVTSGDVPQTASSSSVNGLHGNLALSSTR